MHVCSRSRSQRWPALRVVCVWGMLLVCGMLLVACAAQDEAVEEPDSAVFQPPQEGTRIEPPREVADFTLTDQQGDPFTLSDMRGQPVLLYFGYTFCPDICPTTLADMVRVKRDLGDDASEVAFIFVSVDPDRDTPQVIDKYLDNFDPDFIGLYGEEMLIRKIGVDYGLFFEKQEVEGTSADYIVDHTAASFLIDQQGRLSVIYGYGTPPTAIANDIREMLDSGDG